MSSLVFSVYFDITFTLLSKVSINILILPIVLSCQNPLAQMLPHFRIQDHERMLAARHNYPSPLLIAVRIAIAVDNAVRRVIIGMDIANNSGIGIQATLTTAQTGRVLDTIAFSECLF